MKKIIILLLVLLMSACSAVKPAETLSSMQTEPAAETTVTETAAPEKMTGPTQKETETVIETPKEEATAPSVIEHPEQNPAPETTTATTVEAPVEPIKTETTTESPITAKAPAETAKEEKPTRAPTVETPPESDTETPKAEFDINYWVNFARAYALQIGLEIDETAVDCWDNPTTANADCIPGPAHSSRQGMSTACRTAPSWRIGWDGVPPDISGASCPTCQLGVSLWANADQE